MEIEDRLVTDSSEIDDAFNDHFATTGSKLADKIGLSSDGNLSFCDYLPAADSVFSSDPVYHKRVLELMLELSDKKVTGLDGVSGTVIKLSAHYIVMQISNIFNCSIQYFSIVQYSIFPDEWKSARVTPVF